MKKIILTSILALSLTSCYVHEYTIGKGAQKNITQTEKNHFFINGLVKGKAANPESMANGAKDYNIKTRFTFVDAVIGAITSFFGVEIYKPSTTTVTK